MEIIYSLIGAIGTVIGIVITYLTFVRSRDKTIRKEAEQHGVISTQLNSISKGIDDILVDMKVHEKQMNRMNEQLIRVDEGMKSAHKRIDKLEGKK